MFCEADGVSERESEFLAALDQAASYTILRQSLSLLDGTGQIIGTFSVMEDETMEKAAEKLLKL